MTGRGLQKRFAIRTRLTLVFSATCFILGLILVGVMYVQLDRILAQQLRVSARTDPAVPALSAPSTPSPAYGRTDVQTGPQTGMQTGPPNELRRIVDLQFEYARDQTLRDMFLYCLALLGLLGVAAGSIGWFLAGQFLRPLRGITGTARQVAGQTLHQRIALDGPNDEIKDLADTLDAMLERLDRSFESQQRFIANAAHELRTPLALNRTLIEVEMLHTDDVSAPLRELGHKLIEINARHERLIDGLLTLAVSDQPLSTADPVDLADLVRRVLGEGGPAAGEKAPDIETALTRAVVTGAPVLLERAVHNLVENAVRYNLPRQGWVKISTGTYEEMAVLTVENTGPVIPAADISGLLEPFRRFPGADRLVDPATSGTKRGAGLGLSIVRSVARAHGGEVVVHARRDGGLVVSVHLPRAGQA